MKVVFNWIDLKTGGSFQALYSGVCSIWMHLISMLSLIIALIPFVWMPCSEMLSTQSLFSFCLPISSGFLSFLPLCRWESTSHDCRDFLLYQVRSFTVSPVYVDSVMIFLVSVKSFKKSPHPFLFRSALYLIGSYCTRYLSSLSRRPCGLLLISWMPDLCRELKTVFWKFLLYLTVEYFWGL